MKRILFLFSFIFYNGIVNAQNYTMFNYSLEEGLPSSEVYQVFQDKEGFIWFATDNGVMRFDGKDMQYFHVKDGLSDPVVFGFQEDKEGRIWFMSYTGKLSFFENGKIYKYQYNDKIDQFVQRGVPTIRYSFKENKIKIISRNYFAQIDEDGNLTSEILNGLGLHYFDENNEEIWGLTDYTNDKLSIYINKKEFSVELSKEPYQLSNYRAPSRAIRWRGKLYLSIRNNLFAFDGQSIHRVYTGHSPIISLSVDIEDNFWIGYYNGGAEKHKQEDFSYPKKLQQLNDFSVSSILQDKEKGIWVSTLESGVFYIPNTSIENILPENKMKTMFVISHGDSIFKSNQKGDLEIINGKTKETENRLTFKAPPTFFYMTQSKRLFIFSGISTYIFNSLMNLEREHSINLSSFIEEKDGSEWGYGDGAIREFDKEGNLIYRKKLIALYRSFIIHDSQFYLAGKTGIHVLDKQFELVSSPSNLSNYKISKLISLTDSTILISTLGSGLLLLNTNNWKYSKYDIDNNFVANNIYTTIKKDSTLWFGTEVGVIKMNLNSLLDGKPEYERWDKKNGLIGNDIKFLAVTSSNVWAFADNGYSVIPKNQLDNPPTLPKPYLKSLTINDSTYQSFSTDITLDYKNTNINLKIGYLSLTNQDITSRYRLSKNDAWIYTKERVIPFNSLAPDEYTFELEYTIDHVNWIPGGINFNFTVIPPWWQQWYFISGFILVLLAIVFLYARFQIKNYKQKNRLLNLVNIQQQKLVHAEIKITERERKRIAKELHDGVGTSLTAIRLGVMSQLTRNANSTLAVQEIENQFQTALKEIKDIAYDLTPPDLERYGFFSALTGYVNKLTRSIGIAIELNTYGKDLPESEIALSVFRILQELISNSLKHAEAKKISITINGFDDLLSIIFEDDGVGFDPNTIKKGLGLANIESRVQLLNGKILMESMDFGVSYLIDIPIKENNLD